MFYIALAVLLCTCVYLYKTMVGSSDYKHDKNSIDAFIIASDEESLTSVGNVTVSKYKQDYTDEGRQVLILYGTEYGCSEEIAKLLYDRIQGIVCDDSQPLQPRLINARDYRIVDFIREQVCLIVISTSGDGVPPTDARELYDHLTSVDTDWSHIGFSVLALGDSNYPQFCKTGRIIHNRMLELGGQCVVKRHDVDMEDWSVIDQWLDSVEQYLRTADLVSSLDYIQHGNMTEDKYSRHRPFLATLKVKRLLTVCEEPGDKETVHCEFDTTGSDLTWTSGDALGIYPQNNPTEVERLLSAMKCEGNLCVNKPAWAYQLESDPIGHQLDLYTALLMYYDLKSIKSELLLALRDNLTDPGQLEHVKWLLQDGITKTNCQLKDYLYQREVADVLLDCNCHTLPWQQIISCLKSLQPRYYSISSSPKVDSNTVCVTAAVVRYTTNDQPRTGVTTTYLQDRLVVGDRCPVFMSRNPDFRLPACCTTPVILIGPGTGIAPFMAFIQERDLESCSGPVLLYFGCRHKEKDFLYKSKLEQWSADGVIQLAVAFSRDQTEKVYVQDLLLRDRQQVWKLIDQHGASVYVCGDAKHMAHDVHSSLLAIVKGEGHMNENEAVTYLQCMESQDRYQKDVWVV